MNRWSLTSIFRDVSAKDFLRAVEAIHESMKPSHTAIETEILLYNGVKSSTTTFDPEIHDWGNRRNEAMIFMRLSNPGELKDWMWDSATYIEARVTSAEKGYAHIEAKGLLSRQMNFYAHTISGNEDIENCAAKPFRLWLKGDGMKSNHIVTFC